MDPTLLNPKAPGVIPPEVAAAIRGGLGGDANAAVPPPLPTGDAAVAAADPPPQNVLNALTTGDNPVPPAPNFVPGQPQSAPAPENPLNTLAAPPATARPQLAPHKATVGERIGKILPYIGAIGGALEAAGGPEGHAPVGAQMLRDELAAEKAGALKRAELQNVEIPKAKAYADYMSGRNETTENVAGTRANAATSVQGLKNTGAVALQNVKDKGAYQRELLRQGAPMVVSPQMAELAEQPELAGKSISGATLKNFSAALRAHGAGIKDLGQEGLWVVDNTGRRLHQISVSSPSMTRAVAGRQAGVVDVYDENGDLVPMTDAERLQRGLPKAQTEFSQQGPTAATRTAGQAAGAVASHIPEFKTAVDNLARKGELGPLMGRLNEFLTKGYGGNDPDVANFLTTLKLLKSGAVRAHFGARGGAQILQSFDQTLNPAMTPQAIKGSIDAIGTFLNTYGDIGKFQPNRPGATAKPAPSGNVAPEGTIIKVGNAQQIKRNGKWVPYTGQ